MKALLYYPIFLFFSFVITEYLHCAEICDIEFEILSASYFCVLAVSYFPCLLNSEFCRK